MAGPAEQPHDMWTDNVSANLPNNVGYHVNLPHVRWASANARLFAGDYSLALFVRDYRASFTLQGTTAQAQLQRDFYARSFQQVSYVVDGQCPNQAYYNLLGEFIHYGQRKAITTNTPMRLEVDPSGTPSVRGADAGFIAEGFVDQMERGGAFGEFAPEYNFNFIVSNMLEGLYDEDPVQIRKLKSWAEILTDIPADTWVVDPDAEEISGRGGQFVGGALGATLGGGGLGSYWEWLQGLLGK